MGLNLNESAHEDADTPLSPDEQSRDCLMGRKEVLEREEGLGLRQRPKKTQDILFTTDGL